MTVYARTEEGQLAAYSPDSVLPRKLRSLLKVVDGKTPTSVYTGSLKAFGDVEGVLVSLSMAGLIRPLVPQQLTQTTGFEQTNAVAQTNPQWTSSLPAQDSNTQATYMSTRHSMQDPAVEQARAQALMRAVDAMSIFVLSYAPEHSFLVLKELEQLANLDQLAVTLGGYEQQISHVGAPAQEHILLIKQILRDHL